MTKKDDTPDDLIGFKDFIDHHDIQKAKQSLKEKNQGFDLLTFLDREFLRLTKQKELLEEKTYMMKTFPQDIQLMAREENLNFNLQDQVLERISNKKAPFFKALDEILTDHFNY